MYPSRHVPVMERLLPKAPDHEPRWDYIVTDVTEGRSGNEERIAFVYDRRRVRFDHLAGEVSLPAAKEPVWQRARSPFL